MSQENRYQQYPQVNFRAGELADDLESREDRGLSRSEIAKRDLGRYYQMLRESLPRFTEPEAMLLMDALNGTFIEPHTARLLWAEIDDAIRGDGLAGKWDVDGEVLVQRLRDDLTPFERLAIADAVERAWPLVQGPEPLSMSEAVRTVGLVRD